MYLFTDEILWYELSENTPLNPTQSNQHIGGLASALQILHHYKQEWSEDDVVSIIDEMTSRCFCHMICKLCKLESTFNILMVY